MSWAALEFAGVVVVGMSAVCGFHCLNSRKSETIFDARFFLLRRPLDEVDRAVVDAGVGAYEAEGVRIVGADGFIQASDPDAQRGAIDERDAIGHNADAGTGYARQRGAGFIALLDQVAAVKVSIHSATWCMFIALCWWFLGGRIGR
jgi:hypothetical protein